MLDDYIFDDLDSLDVESDASYSDESPEDDITDSFEPRESSFFDFTEDSSNSILDDESLSTTNKFVESSDQLDAVTHGANPYRPVSFGHSLGWNGRCRVCSCGGWAGFGDTCACCGHFYKDHI